MEAEEALEFFLYRIKQKEQEYPWDFLPNTDKGSSDFDLIGERDYE